MHDTNATYDSALAEARRIGTEHGEAAASWCFDGNTSVDTYRRVLDGIEEGDPEVWDTLPAPDLSGEWADGITPSTLAAECGVPECDWADPANTPTFSLIEDCCITYEEAFSTAVHDAIEATCRRALADD